MTSSTEPPVPSDDRAPTGVSGLDDVLHGGFARDRLYLIDGDPGTGKTTVAIQFLLEGMRRGESGLYVTLSETADELRAVAASHGWSLDGVAIHELATEDTLAEDAQYTVFQPSEVELGNTMGAMFQAVERVEPRRVVIDSLSEMRLLARDSLRYRHQILALKQFFSRRRNTVLLLDDRTIETSDRQLHSIVHGVVRLEQLAREYGPARRRLQVIKLRGSAYREGLHDFIIRRGGLVLFPRLVASEHEEAFTPDTIPSGLPALDSLLGGGLTTGSAALIMGPAGVGKSLVAARYAVTAAHELGSVALFLFDEERMTTLRSTASVGIPLQQEVDQGHATVRAVNPAELSPGEFVYLVRDAVERQGAKVVVIDSLNGYLAAMPEEHLLESHLRELFSYLRQRGVLALIVMAEHGLLSHAQSSIEVSYLADVVVLLRYFERDAKIHRAISVLKRRGGSHETLVHELKISGRGLDVVPLVGISGVMAGVPHRVEDGA